MAWISRDSALTMAEMENNATLLTQNYRARGFSDMSIASLLGNAQAESSINPERNEVGGGGGYGIFQWTPKSKLEGYCSTLGLSPYSDGDIQLEVLYRQLTGQGLPLDFSTGQNNVNNYKPSGATDAMVGVTAEEFFTNSKNFTLDELTILFMLGYERPSYDPSINHIAIRITYTTYWFEFIGGVLPPVTTANNKNKFPFWVFMNGGMS